MGSSGGSIGSTSTGVLTQDLDTTHGAGVNGWKSLWSVSVPVDVEVGVSVDVGVEVGVSVDVGVEVGVGADVGTAVGVGVGVAVRVLGCLVVVTGVGDGVAVPSLSSPDDPKSPNGVEMAHPARPPAETAAAVARSRRLLVVGLSPSSVISRQVDCE